MKKRKKLSGLVMRGTDARVFFKLPFDVFNINLYSNDRSSFNPLDGQIGHRTDSRTSNFMQKQLISWKCAAKTEENIQNRQIEV